MTLECTRPKKTRRTGPLHIRRVKNLEELRALSNEWNQLQDTAASKHVLMDHRWLTSWWEHFGQGKEMHTLLIEDQRGERVGICPLMISRGREPWPTRDTLLKIAEDYRHVRGKGWRRWFPIRRVSFPMNVASHNSRMHFLLRDEDDPAPYRAVLDYWAERSKEWDVLSFEGLPVDSPQTLRVMQAAKEAGLLPLAHGNEREICHIELTGTYEDFMKSRSRHSRKRLKREVRRCEQAGEIDFLSFRGAEIDAGLQMLYGLEARSWKAKGDPSRLIQLSLDDRIRSFFATAAHQLTETDEVEIAVMMFNNEPVAGLLLGSRQDTLLTLLIYHDEQHKQVVSSIPLFKRVIEGAIERGFCHIDIHGNTLYAQKWANSTRRYRRTYVFNRRLYSRLLASMKGSANSLSRMIRRQREKSEKKP